jgi:hypothetical protein
MEMPCLGMTKFLTYRQRHELLQNRQRLPVLVYCIRPTAGCSKNFDPYLEALVEELVALHPSISVRKPDPASNLKAEEIDEETRSGEG